MVVHVVAVKQVIYIGKTMIPSRSPLTTMTHRQVGGQQQQLSRKPESATPKQLSIGGNYKMSEDSHTSWWRLMFLGTEAQIAEDWDDAIAYFMEASQVSLVENSDDSLIYAQSIVSLGACCVGKGDYIQAEQLLLQAWKIRRMKTARCHFTVAEVLHLLANCYHGLGQWEMAMQFYNRTLECLAFLSPNHPLYVQVARNAVYCATQQQQEGKEAA